MSAVVSLDDYAARINDAHARAQRDAVSAVEHACQAGTLLIAAKATVAHGRWLPWLRDNFAFSERTAQGYMRLAERLPSLEKRNQVADFERLGVKRALRELATPLKAALDAPDTIAPSFDEDDRDDELPVLKEFFAATQFLEAQMDGQFDGRDLRLGKRWLNAKLRNKCGVPGIVDFLLTAEDEYKPIPMLRLCSAQDLADALEALAPVATRDARVAIDTRTTGLKKVSDIAKLVEVLAASDCGAILTEIDHRSTIDDDTFAAEFEVTRQRFVRTTEARMEAIEVVQAKQSRKEFASINEYAAAFDAANTLPEVAP